MSEAELCRIAEEVEARERLWSSGEMLSDIELSRAFEAYQRQLDEAAVLRHCPNSLTVKVDSLQSDCWYNIEVFNKRWCRQPRDEFEEEIHQIDYGLYSASWGYLERKEAEDKKQKKIS